MEQNQPNQPHTIQNNSEGFGNLPNASADFGTLPNPSEHFRNIPKASERKEYCTLTVREVARMFEVAGVARTERSIINWCQPNKIGVSRLDNYFDPNERKYFISPQSAELAIQEEKAKAGNPSSNPEQPKEARSIPNNSEKPEKTPKPASETAETTIRELEKEVTDLKITNRGKDYFIEQLQKEREAFAQERKGYVEELMTSHRKLGELETKLLQLESANPGARMSSN